MKKKLVSALLVVFAVSTLLVACGNNDSKKEADNKEESTGYEVALVTDVGSIDDKSFNQGSWEGVVEYAKENNLKYKYYKPTEKSDDAFITALNLAVKGGAKVVVCPGYLFEVPIYNIQKTHPDVTFIILDGEPNDGNGTYEITENVKAIYYAEEQAGFLAGYAAVKDGYRNLGFMGGIALPAVVRYGYGFVQGAEYAANELGLDANAVSVKYTYVGNFDASPENMALASSWYNEGIEVIFACGGSVGNSVMKAAESNGTKVIGVDVDQSSESETVITSAMKNLGKSVYDSLSDYYNGAFNGGAVVNLDVLTESVQLPMETSRFSQFTEEEYKAVYTKLAEGEITVDRNDVAETVEGLEVNLVQVNLVQ